ncbi:hypothetical protein C8Q79DRAFT_306396 [Trametes meyenii]|nr:hypothetical protein C8Q79DRAFT_306396 [Trametes meyenii]
MWNGHNPDARDVVRRERTGGARGVTLEEVWLLERRQGWARSRDHQRGENGGATRSRQQHTCDWAHRGFMMVLLLSSRSAPSVTCLHVGGARKSTRPTDVIVWGRGTGILKALMTLAQFEPFASLTRPTSTCSTCSSTVCTSYVMNRTNRFSDVLGMTKNEGYGCKDLRCGETKLGLYDIPLDSVCSFLTRVQSEYGSPPMLAGPRLYHPRGPGNVHASPAMPETSLRAWPAVDAPIVMCKQRQL